MCPAFAVKDPNLKPYSLGTVEAVKKGKKPTNPIKKQGNRKLFVSIASVIKLTHSSSSK